MGILAEGGEGPEALAAWFGAMLHPSAPDVVFRCYVIQRPEKPVEFVVVRYALGDSQRAMTSRVIVRQPMASFNPVGIYPCVWQRLDFRPGKLMSEYGTYALALGSTREEEPRPMMVCFNALTEQVFHCCYQRPDGDSYPMQFRESRPCDLFQLFTGSHMTTAIVSQELGGPPVVQFVTHDNLTLSPSSQDKPPRQSSFLALSNRQLNKICCHDNHLVIVYSNEYRMWDLKGQQLPRLRRTTSSQILQ